MDVLGDDVTSVQQASGHVLAIAGITLHHLVVRLEASIRNLLDAVRFMRSLGCGDDWCIGDQREVDSWVWYQVGLEFVQIDVEGAIKSKRGGDG